MAAKKSTAKKAAPADPMAKDPKVSTTDTPASSEPGISSISNIRGGKAASGPAENKSAEFTPGSRESVAHYAVPMSKAYGTASKEEHRRSGYILPDAFYEEEISEENTQHKVPGNQHNES